MGAYNVIPTNEMMVREWFVAHITEFEFSIIHSQSGFPDWILEDHEGNRFRVEVEYQSLGFINHKHNPKGCDFVLCWRHNCQLPFRVLELLSRKWYEPNEIPTLSSEEKLVAVSLSGLPDKDKIKKAIGGIDSELVNEFFQAMVSDLSARSEYYKILEEPRLRALRATDRVVEALQGKVKIERIHPDDLLQLIT